MITEPQSLNGVVIAMLVSWMIQHAKTSTSKIWSWISSANPGVVRLISALAAALTVVGVTWSYSGDTLTISGVTAANALLFLWEVVKQYAFQHASYRALIKPSSQSAE